MKRFLFLFGLLFLTTSILFSHEIKAIVFDCGGVVVQSNRSQVIKFLAESFEVSQSEFESYLSKERILDLATGKVKEAVFWESFAKKNQLSIPEGFHSHYLSFIKNVFPSDKDILAFVKSLQDSGLQTPMLSDATEWQVEGFRESGLYENFFPVFLSCEIGLKKPDPATFQYLLSQLKLSPEECIFVDDRKVNIIAAKEFGIDAICFTTLDTLKAALKERGIDYKR